jgi:hypothetical protein
MRSWGSEGGRVTTPGAGPWQERSVAQTSTQVGSEDLCSFRLGIGANARSRAQRAAPRCARRFRSRGTLVGMTEQHPDDPVEVLRRWESSGAVWHVLVRQGDAVTVGLFTCDGAEAVSQFTSRDPVLLRFLAAREA